MSGRSSRPEPPTSSSMTSMAEALSRTRPPVRPPRGGDRHSSKASGSGTCTRDSLTTTAAAVLEMCIHCSQWFRPRGDVTIEELELRFVDHSLRIVGCGPLPK